VYNADGAVRAMPLGGGPLTTLAEGEKQVLYPYGLAADATSVYLTSGGAQTSYGRGSILAVPVAGGELRTVTETSGCLDDLAVDETHVYWFDDCKGKLWRVAKEGGVPELVASGLGRISAIALHREMVFFAVLGERSCTTCEMKPEDAKVVKVAKPLAPEARASDAGPR
jgi:hypothetical protein